jgi:NitT/TauT family transport system substrate-binding protein
MQLRFRLNHLYQGQNSPFLHAADAGYFADQGIDCTFIEGFSSSQVTRALAEREADIGFGDVSSVFERALRTGSTDITCLLPVYERSPCSLGYIRDGEPLSLSEVPGATLCGPSGDTSARLLPLLLERNGLPRDSYSYIKVEPAERDRMIANREVLAATCFDATLRFAMVMRGHDPSGLRFLYFADHGLDIYSGALIAWNGILDQHPGLGAKLVAASRQGWHDCLADPEKGVRAVLARSPDLDPAIVRQQLEWILSRQIFPHGKTAMEFDLASLKMTDTLRCAVLAVEGDPNALPLGLPAEICRIR